MSELSAQKHVQPTTEKKRRFRYHRYVLAAIDSVIYLLVAIFVLVIYPSSVALLTDDLVVAHIFFGLGCVLVARVLARIYTQIWRYAGPQEYIRLLAADTVAGLFFVFTRRAIFPHSTTFVRAVALFTVNLLACLATRHIYQWLYQQRMSKRWYTRFALLLLKVFVGISFSDENAVSNRIKIAIVGAGNVGVMLADELQQNPKATYQPVCFVDIDQEKVGREIYGIPVLSSGNSLKSNLVRKGVQEVVFALPNVPTERRQELYQIYEGFGYKIKAYDYPALEESGKRHIRDFAVEDLLFRSANQALTETTRAYYRGRSVLITGGGGSIGSELARQIARCEPSRLVLLDVYENGVYDIQQELKTRYGSKLNLRVEIANVCNRDSIDKILRENTPDIVLHAAAHKHVPLMERNVIEAVENNVFGTLNVVEACESSGVKRFIMVSTDKAVNPTNVMGATKRMCEMIVLSRTGKVTSFSATRFGNVLGSNGSVIPLFKRQIQRGGPITITDKRITRYYMTIPEASQLVMISGAMASNGELYVLDMGEPIRILELAEDMIRLSGMEPYRDIDIVEVGLRPGEKLYEELLIRTEEMDKTDNDLIFIERDKRLEQAQVRHKLDILREAVATGSNHLVREALMKAVPTYHSPEEVNDRPYVA